MTENHNLAIRVSQGCFIIEAKDKDKDSCYISYSFEYDTLSCSGQDADDYLSNSDLTPSEILEVFRAVRDFIIEKRNRENA